MHLKTAGPPIHFPLPHLPPAEQRHAPFFSQKLRWAVAEFGSSLDSQSAVVFANVVTCGILGVLKILQVRDPAFRPQAQGAVAQRSETDLMLVVGTHAARCVRLARFYGDFRYHFPYTQGLCTFLQVVCDCAAGAAPETWFVHQVSGCVQGGAVGRERGVSAWCVV